jgi:hypothetical protein
MVQVSNSTLYVVHNVLRWLQGRPQIYNYLKPFDKLNNFVTELQLPCVICKPQISSTADWKKLLSQGYPYSANCLIFARTFENPIETWKWKATNVITINFMLWNSIIYNDRLQFNLFVLKSSAEEYGVQIVR